MAQRIALFSDVHANLPALEAVLAVLDRRGDLDQVLHLGDLVGYAPWPNETVEAIRERGISGVAGNYDSTVATRYDHCGCQYDDPEQQRLSHESYGWTLQHTSAETANWLGTLPFRVDLRLGGGHTASRTLILVHATPLRNTVYWTEDRPDAFCTKMIQAAGARPGDILAFGHTHKPWRRVVDGVHLVNTGSVGRPKDGDPRAGYCMLTVEEGTVDVSVERVAYDLDRAVRGIRESELPDAFAHYLESGGCRLTPE